MENQHRQIKGYRDLDQDDIDLMNEIKQQGVELKGLYDKAADRIKQDMTIDPNERMRWLNIGRTGYQQALMALTRAVAAPNFE